MIRRTLEEIARQQQGYFTSQQAIASGYAHQHHAYHTGKGNWLCVERGLFRLPGYADSAESEFIRWSFWAVGRSSMRRIAISHDSALFFYGFCATAPNAVHLSVPTKLFRKEERMGCVFHRQDLQEGDVLRHPGFCVTTPLRTLLDMKPDLMLRGVWAKVVHAAMSAGRIGNEEGRLLLGAELFQQIARAPSLFSAAAPGQGPLARTGGAEMRRTISNRSFTLVEMLVIIALIAILAALLMPALQSSYETSKSVACVNQFSQIGNGLFMYAGDYNQYLPIAHTVSNATWKWPVIEPTGYRKNSQVNWTNRLAPAYFNQTEMLKCPAAAQEELSDMGDGWKSNYTYNAYLGWIDGSGGDVAKPNGGMKRITTCRKPTAASLVVDGQNKTRYTTAFMRSLSRPVARHNDQWNVLFADGHVEADRDDLLTTGVFPSLYFSNSYGNSNDNLHSRATYQYENADGSVWSKYW